MRIPQQIPVNILKALKAAMQIAFKNDPKWQRKCAWLPAPLCLPSVPFEKKKQRPREGQSLTKVTQQDDDRVRNCVFKLCPQLPPDRAPSSWSALPQLMCIHPPAPTILLRVQSLLTNYLTIHLVE